MSALPRCDPFMPPRRQPRGGCLAAAGAGRMCVGMLRVPACVADQNIPATQTPKELAASPSASTVISARFMVYPLSGANTALGSGEKIKKCATAGSHVMHPRPMGDPES